ncbi:InlB B-repeat-containing protein [uncultured Pontibacter sp.]|uniref:InlB B-repeat-containing protein n=1 Tax=uncultured Pontibacter sp. TaxID=453356 RepID=UPI00262C0C55|nr:InlB B-repeat-containing protein [uncultured Pontibacter sp.]
MIEVDDTGRMWLAYDGSSTVNVRWSDAPYTQWSSPITLASGIASNDKCAIIAMPGKIGVFWSNQNTKRWGFKTHTDGDSPTNWSVDEVPASQSALNVGYGMADDHMNLKVASDGTLYCAIKTGYNDESYPLIGLLVRRANGTWDNLYDVSRLGTTPIVVLNEDAGKLRIVYSSRTYGGDILYNESPISNISIGPQMTLKEGARFRDPTSSKQNFNPDGLILITNVDAGVAVGVLASDDGSSPDPTDKFHLTINTIGDGTVAKTPSQETYDAGSAVSLTATPAAGYRFAGWGGDASGTANPLTVTMDGDKAVTATFEAIPASEYSLAVSTTGGGAVSKSPDRATYTAGSAVSLTATPATGYQFAGWGGDASGTANPLTVTMDGDKAVTATFTAVTAGPSQVTGFTLVDAQTEQDVQPLEDGATISLSSLSNSKLNIRANTSPTSVGSVLFELSGTQSRTYSDNAAPYALHGDNGSGNYYYGNWNPPAVGTYTLKATPYSGSKATGAAGTPLTIRFTVVEQVVTPTDKFHLTINTIGDGTVAKTPSQETYDAGSAVSLTATPATGYQFAGWGGDASGTANPLTVTMDGDKAVTATFTAVTAGPSQVTGFTLVDAQTEQDVQPLEDGATISLSSLSNSKLNIRANTSPTSVGSVLFELSGTQSRTYSDNAAPYALHGDNGSGNYYYGNWNPPAVGTYTLKATPYSGSKATGAAGTPLTIRFTVVESNLTTQSEKSLFVNQPRLEKLSAHPNPFSDKARVRFTVSEGQDYTLSLYDSKGSLIKTLHQGKTVSGQLHQIDIDGTDLGKGLYILRLQTKSKNETFRLMLDR